MDRAFSFCVNQTNIPITTLSEFSKFRKFFGTEFGAVGFKRRAFAPSTNSIK